MARPTLHSCCFSSTSLIPGRTSKLFLTGPKLSLGNPESFLAGVQTQPSHPQLTVQIIGALLIVLNTSYFLFPDYHPTTLSKVNSTTSFTHNNIFIGCLLCARHSSKCFMWIKISYYLCEIGTVIFIPLHRISLF